MTLPPISVPKIVANVARRFWNLIASAQTRWRAQLSRVNELEAPLLDKSDADLRRESRSLKYRAGCGEPLEHLLPEAFALVREAARRAIGMRHYDVQILGGAAIFDGSIAEMQTGEGKTLTATLPLYLASLVDQGAHLATANDYLAARDAEMMRPIFERLGSRVGVVVAGNPTADRREAYACEITYGTAKEFGFDFLRDRLANAAGEPFAHGDSDGGGNGNPSGVVQRGLYFALVDEADSLLIDEARTPLIISSLPGDEAATRAALFHWAARSADEFHEDSHYSYDARARMVTLTASGRRLTRQLQKPDLLAAVEMFDIYEQVERAIKVCREFVPERHYVVREGEIVIVDELTGRLAEGRKWRDGIHQAVEAREGLEVTVETGEAARVAIQDYFLQYRRLAGMTGTALSSGRELSKIYDLRVSAIPTNRPPRRSQSPDRVLPDSETKWRAIVEQCSCQHELGRPVLIGTRSIDKSERCSAFLREAGIEHEVLNARQHEAEAEIVAAAGGLGRVTVATNMAGRGTDIRLGDGVMELGGLHVICSELHESARIDRQLIGRCGRQGDPGSFQQFLALDDEILDLGLGVKAAARLRRLARGDLDRLAPIFRRAQARVEAEHFRQRRALLQQEKLRRRLQKQMGQDPYLDAA